MQFARHLMVQAATIIVRNVKGYLARCSALWLRIAGQHFPKSCMVSLIAT